MATFTDFSQLKPPKPVPTKRPPPAAPPPPAARALADAATSTDYFSSLLGGGDAAKTKPVRPPRATVVTPATLARVRREQAEDAQAARDAAFAAREAILRDERDAQKAAAESLATDLAAVRAELETCRADLAAARADRETCQAELRSCRTDRETLEAERRNWTAERARLTEELRTASARPDETALAEKDREIERLQALLLEEQRDVRLHDSLLDRPECFSEKFPGEVREHVLETLVAAGAAAEAGGRDRRARILEAVLGANPPSGELERRRERVKQTVKEAGHKLDNAALAQLEKLGFRYVSGKNHHKLEWAGIRFPLAKTPSDYRSCLNSAAEICNRVF